MSDHDSRRTAGEAQLRQLIAEAREMPASEGKMRLVGRLTLTLRELNAAGADLLDDTVRQMRADAADETGQPWSYLKLAKMSGVSKTRVQQILNPDHT